jgi:hypothetical protein
MLDKAAKHAEPDENIQVVAVANQKILGLKPVRSFITAILFFSIIMFSVNATINHFCYP